MNTAPIFRPVDKVRYAHYTEHISKYGIRILTIRSKQLMVRKKIEPASLSNEVIQEIEQEWYTAGEAAKKLTENSKRAVTPSYVSKLGSLGKIRMKKIHDRLVLYSKSDIDRYKVESRGKKSGAAAQARSKQPTAA
jgi:hypothetical protein